MEYALPALVGVLCGLLSGLPYTVATVLVRKSREATILPAVGAACVSLVVIMVSVLIGWLVFSASVVWFAIGMVAAFLIVVVASVLVFVRKPR